MRIKEKIVNAMMIVFGFVFSTKKNRVVFISFGGKSYSDNPKAISERLNSLNPKMEIYWVFISPKSHKNKIPNYIHNVRLNTIRYFYIMATSKVWIDNFAKPYFYHKKKSQVYIQTWHGDRSFKKIVYDAWESGNRPQKILDETRCDYIITGSLFSEKMYRTALRYKGEYLKYGSPRNDALFKGEKNNKSIKDIIGVDNNKKIVLFAPTLRQQYIGKTEKQDIGNIDFDKLTDRLQQVTGDNWIVLIRAHSAMFGIKTTSLNCIDVSKYDDMTDLLGIADLLITDYSSSATDFILTNKPVILYQNDLKEYVDKDRKFYYDVEKTGFTIVYSNQELLDIINILFTMNFKDINNQIKEFYGVYEIGNAGYLTAKKILEICKMEII